MRTRLLPLLRTVRRVRGPVPVVTELQTGRHSVYAVPLTALPSRPWRAAFVRPPARMTTARFTPHCREPRRGERHREDHPGRVTDLAPPDRPLDRLRQLGGGGMRGGARMGHGRVPPAEWQLLEKPVRAGRWTSGPRTDAARFRALAAELGMALREEGVVR
jgi:hypothetical protein